MHNLGVPQSVVVQRGRVHAATHPQQAHEGHSMKGMVPKWKWIDQFSKQISVC